MGRNVQPWSPAIKIAVLAAVVSGAAVYVMMRGGSATDVPLPAVATAIAAGQADQKSAPPSPPGEPKTPATATTPATQPAGHLSFYDLASDNLEEVLEDYRMPLELDNDSAKRLIEMTSGVPAKLNRATELTGVYRQYVNRLTTNERTWQFWLRVESGKGFKDPTIGRDWSTVKLDNMGFVSFLESVLGLAWTGSRMLYINNRIQEVRVTLVGGRMTWGHRRFIESTDHWAGQTIERLERDIKAMAELEQRCLQEGL